MVCKLALLKTQNLRYMPPPPPRARAFLPPPLPPPSFRIYAPGFSGSHPFIRSKGHPQTRHLAGHIAWLHPCACQALVPCFGPLPTHIHGRHFDVAPSYLLPSRPPCTASSLTRLSPTLTYRPRTHTHDRYAIASSAALHDSASAAFAGRPRRTQPPRSARSARKQALLSHRPSSFALEPQPQWWP